LETKIVLKNARIHGVLQDLTIIDGKIAEIGVSEAPGIDCKGHLLYPGLVDVHTHGCEGLDTMDSDLAELSRRYRKAGVTAFLPTTMTMPYDDLRAVTAHIPTTDGAHILGFHLEGPYISEQAKGAQNAEHIAPPDLGAFSAIPHVKMVTIAPEAPGAIPFIQGCEAIVSLGHTTADYDTCVAAAEAGAKCLSHTCNAMPLFHHRAPGPIGAALDTEMYAQLICDGIHIHPAMVRALYNLFGKERLILISDSMRATGMPDGTYNFGGQKMLVTDGVARTEDGALAGSTSTLLDCVKQAISMGIPAEDAFYMASATPAKLLGVNKGLLKVGYDADFILLDDGYNLIDTFIFS
jgi:N-acetylglucosamine-6-phosphate deacetylase